jgi:ribosomal protein S18 acetylase RimI-like enzyme
VVLTIRTAERDDLDEVVRLWETSAGPTRHAGQRPEAARLLEHDPDALLLAELDGELVGTLIVGWDGWRCHLYRLAVVETARRQGVGRALLRRALSRVIRLGAARVDAMVDLENGAGVAFWESEGFEFDQADGRWSLMLNKAPAQ